MPLGTPIAARISVEAAEILDEFAARGRRYLWTDALAVMTWVGLYETSGERRYLDLALRVVDEVHAVLGVARSKEHPTASGLRIGKPLPERRPEEPYDPELEWERDGQYYHYLTKWMQALQRVNRATGDERYRHWAIELARTAHRAFIHPGGIYWKMSIDLSRPLVPAMGAHDPLEGFIEAASLGLEREAGELAPMCEGRGWASADPLGAGGLLLAALRLARLGLDDLLSRVLEDALLSVQASAESLRGPAARRLAFRELGLALGLHAVKPLQAKPLERYVPLGRELERFWLEPRHQAAATWTGHLDINAVTLAACLAPQGVLN